MTKRRWIRRTVAGWALAACALSMWLCRDAQAGTPEMRMATNADLGLSTASYPGSWWFYRLPYGDPSGYGPTLSTLSVYLCKNAYGAWLAQNSNCYALNGNTAHKGTSQGRFGYLGWQYGSGVPVYQCRSAGTTGAPFYLSMSSCSYSGSAVGYYGAADTGTSTSSFQGTPCDTSCMGQCGPGCSGVLGTHYTTWACSQHDECVRSHGCNRFDLACLPQFAAAAVSWAVTAAYNVVSAVVSAIASVISHL